MLRLPPSRMQSPSEHPPSANSRERIGIARRPWWGALLSLAVGAIACHQAPSVVYNITLRAPADTTLLVTLQVDGVPHDGLTLKGYAAAQIMRLRDVEAWRPFRAPLEAKLQFDTTSIEGIRAEIPRVTVRGPLPSAITVRYSASAGKREGDAHIGFTGRRYGFVGENFALISGRNLLLIPQPAEGIRRAELHLTLPPGWRSVAPWRGSGSVWHPGVRGQPVAEDLISGSLGLGEFRIRARRIGRTEYRFAFAPSISRPEEERASVLLERVASYLHAVFQRDLGPSYTTIVVPESPDRDEVLGEAWGTGQGGTLVPLTAGRLHEFSRRLIEGYLLDAPYRSMISAPEEYWLVDGITGLYSWRAVAKAGLVHEDDVVQSLAIAYVAARTARGVERDLERVYSSRQDTRLAREVIAPLALAALDHELRSRAGSPRLDEVLGGMSRGRRMSSFWSLLPGTAWEQFRARYVRGGEALPIEDLAALPPTRAASQPPAGPPVKEFTFIFTGSTRGFLENCGCKVNQSGGVARRATVVKRIRDANPEAVLLDAGSGFMDPGRSGDLDFLAQHEESLYLRSMSLLRYDAAAIGTTELASGIDHFRAQSRGTAIPYLAANVQWHDQPIAPALVRLHAAGLRIAVIGLFEPPCGPEAPRLFESRTAGLEFTDPVEALCRAVPALKREGDLVVALGRLAPATIRRAVQACPDLDVIISSENNAVCAAEQGGRGELRTQDTPGYLGRTLVLYADLDNFGLNSVRIGVDATGRVASAALLHHWLYEDVPDDPGVRAMLTRFYDRVGRTQAAQSSVHPLFAGDSTRIHGVYVGAARCKDCHRPEYEQWRTTPHASAYKTLLDAHRHYQPRCVVCHTVGFGTAHGYRVGDPKDTLVNVQCEVCHGPAGEHVRSPSAANVRRKVPPTVCLECHNPDHSDGFDYARRLASVRHDRAAAAHSWE